MNKTILDGFSEADIEYYSHGEYDLKPLQMYRQKGEVAGTGLKNFQMVLPGRLYRSSQPNYVCRDSEHIFNSRQVDTLKANNIQNIVSLNAHKLSKTAQDSLLKDKIRYQHLKIIDFKAPTLEQLTRVVNSLSYSPGASLVYCGFGEGRTGTIVSAFAIKYLLAKNPDFFDDFRKAEMAVFLRLNFGVEMYDQFDVLVRFLKELKSTESVPPMPPLKIPKAGANNEQELPPIPPPKIPKPGFKSSRNSPPIPPPKIPKTGPKHPSPPPIVSSKDRKASGRLSVFDIDFDIDQYI